jgi:DNA recombination protein RmuC
MAYRRAGTAPAQLQARLEALERAQERTERTVRDELGRGRQESTGAAAGLRDEVGKLGDASVRKLEELRATVDAQLNALRAENTQKLDDMRRTVDEKLQATLEERLGASFRQVSERLEQVHQGLGEMRTLASGVGDLKRVLSNVKVRGTWGEVQLGGLLEQVLSPDQYACNVATREGSSERVEFAIRLPGPEGREGETVWLPIDAKFPQEDYLRLVEASERGDTAGVDQAGRDLETAIKAAARDIHDKYLEVPRTTDFAILFLPTEGLYAEVLRRTGLVELLQRQFRVMVAGPTTLWAVLTSLRTGFRTLAIQKRSSEVWQLLGTVKSEFTRFGGMLDHVQKKLEEASKKVDEARKGSRKIEKRLGDVQELPAAEGQPLLEAPLFDADIDTDTDTDTEDETERE